MTNEQHMSFCQTLLETDVLMDEVFGKAVSPILSFVQTMWHSRVFGVVYYVLLALLVAVTVMFHGADEETPRHYFGFTGMVVLTRSMQNTLPQGSFVLVRNVDPNTLQVGDDITFLHSETAVITHRIVGIEEDFADTGGRAFITQGTANPARDQQPVLAINVVGRVVFNNMFVGQLFTFVQNNLLLCVILLVLLYGLFFGLRLLFSTMRATKNKCDFHTKSAFGL